MALKADRSVSYNQNYFMDEVAERGSFVFAHPRTLGSPNTVVTKSPGPNPRMSFVGVLLDDVVDIDLTRQHINWSQNEVQKGGKVSIATRGWLVMKIPFRDTYPLGHPVYVNPKTGRPSLIQWGIPIGRMMSKRDRDGFAKIEIGN